MYNKVAAEDENLDHDFIPQSRFRLQRLGLLVACFAIGVFGFFTAQTATAWAARNPHQLERKMTYLQLLVDDV